MSNYNTTLENHNENLQSLLTQLNNLPKKTIKLQNKIFNENGTYAADSEYNGLGAVTIDVNDEIDHTTEDNLISNLELTTYTNNRVTTIGSQAFTHHFNLLSVDFSNVVEIGDNAFTLCPLISVSFPQVTTIGAEVFAGCSNLTAVSFPRAQTIGGYAFNNCTNLTTVSFPQATLIKEGAFNNCTKLTTVSFPRAAVINGYAFSSCTNLTTINLSQIVTVYNNTFQNCTNLTTVSLPRVVTVYNNAFNNCTNLATISLPRVQTISGYGVFNNCYNLMALYLTGPSVCTLTNSSIFQSTPFDIYWTSTNTYGSIYVPASLLTQYQSATNWAYFSSRFVGI